MKIDPVSYVNTQAHGTAPGFAEHLTSQVSNA